MSVIKEMAEAISQKASDMTEIRNSLIEEANGTIDEKLNENLEILNSMKAEFDEAEATRADEHAAELKATEVKMKAVCDAFINDSDEEAWNDIAGAYAEIVAIDADEDAGIIAFGDAEKAELAALAASIGDADDVTAIFDAA